VYDGYFCCASAPSIFVIRGFVFVVSLGVRVEEETFTTVQSPKSVTNANIN